MIWNTLLQLHAQLRAQPTAEASYRNSGSARQYNFATVVLPAAQTGGHNVSASGTLACATADIRLGTLGDPSVFHLLLKDSTAQNELVTLSVPEPFSFTLPESHQLSTADAAELALYLPYALLPWFAHQLQRCFAISHFAQTLDGRIAASSGDSKWIGNTENLNHSHKMRALCDAILVGSSTLRADRPRLSVRHVEGKNPLRVILGNNCQEADIVTENTGPLLWINTSEARSGIEQLTLDATNGKIDCRDIMNALFQRGVCSVYIEGGAATTSNFIQSSALDQVQVHLSPKILGSGITGFNFGGVDNMDNAINFNNPRFISIGNEVMFVGEIFR